MYSLYICLFCRSSSDHFYQIWTIIKEFTNRYHQRADQLIRFDTYHIHVYVNALFEHKSVVSTEDGSYVLALVFTFTLSL